VEDIPHDLESRLHRVVDAIKVLQPPSSHLGKLIVDARKITITNLEQCGINYGTCVSWLAVLGTTVALIFAPPPYLFSNSAIGLVWFSPLIGSLIGAYFSGPLNDRLTVYLSNRNRGWREPEYRLWAFIPAAFIMPGGLIIYGATAAHGLPWIVPVVGMGLVGFGLSVGGTVTMSYILDSYKEIDTQVVTTIILIRNIIGFGISFGIQS
jgi:MFS family permease